MSDCPRVKIYRLFVEEAPECYIGSTKLQLGHRWDLHRNSSNPDSKGSKCASSYMFNMYGSDKVKIELIEEVDEKDGSIIEAQWISAFRPYSLNQKMPQPLETSQTTHEGKMAYMDKWREQNKEQIRKYNAERRANRTEEQREHEAALRRIWGQNNRDAINEKRRGRWTCPTCGVDVSVGHKHEHTAEICSAGIVQRQQRRADIEKAVSLKSSGLSSRAIAADPYFVARGIKTHFTILQLLKENAQLSSPEIVKPL